MKTPANILDLDAQLCFALYSSSLAMTKVYKPLLAELGLTYPQYLVMLALWQHGTLGVGELGARLFLDSGTLTPLLKRLEANGLVRRVRSHTDERRVHIHLTESGHALRQRARAVPGCLLQATGCSMPELQTLTRQVQALRSRLAQAHIHTSDIPPA